MEVNGEYTFDAPQELVWQALQDPAVLGSVMPGGQAFEQVGDNEYAGALKIKVGPVQGAFQGHIRLLDIVAPESYRMEVDGNGAPGFVKASGGLKLTGQGDRTHMVYEGEAQVGGRIASVGQRLLDTAARSIIRQSLEGLNDYLKVKAAETAAASTTAQSDVSVPPPVPEYRPPSQTAVAVNVARDVTSDLLPPQYRPLLIGLGVIVALAILYLLLT